jgi:DNA replication and repair protein RecF
MHFALLRLRDLRGIAEAELELHPRLNVFTGPNGAGKTSVLEAMHLLSYGRSFRRGPRGQLIRRGASALVVYGEVEREHGGCDRLGLGVSESGLELHLNGQVEDRLGELLKRCAVCCHEPGSHDLIAGPAELRRAYLDWSLFHVEPAFWSTWRRFQRALQQRNAVLRQGGSPADLAPWDRELIEHGVRITQWRSAFLRTSLEPALARYLSDLLPDLGAIALTWEPGWSGSETEEGYAQALATRLGRDRERRQTGAGPHRADWRIRFERAPIREHLSRGQEKLTALACTLAQTEVLRRQTGEWPIVCFDDLASELDLAHARYALALLREGHAQTVVTGTHFDPALQECLQDGYTFHVEQGVVSKA